MKKFLSLVLALVMTMSLVTVSAGAKDFTDNDAITYDEAVAVMSEIGVIDGYTTGDFKPTATLTRGAAAKIICNLILGPTTASALAATTAPFSDVAADSTFAGYIAYLAKEGIIGGYADGTFKPGNSLTGYAFLKMLLGALGYEADIEGYNGANYAVSVAKQAIEAGLTDGLVNDFDGRPAVTREEACLYAFNTLKAIMVEYDNRIVVGEGATAVAISGVRKDLSWNKGTKNDGNIEDDGYVQFAEQYFPKLEKEDTTDAFGRPASTWSYKSEEIGTYVRNDLLVESYTAKVTGKTLYELLGKSVIADYDVFVYVDGETEEKYMTITTSKGSETAYFTAGSLVKGNTEKVGKTGDGVLTEVYVDSDAKEVTIAIINTYLAKASKDYSAKTEKAEFVVWGIENKGSKTAAHYTKNTAKTEKLEVSADDFDIADVAKDDIVLVTVADGAIQEILDAEVLSEVEISAFKKGSNLTVDGTKYGYADTACYDGKTLVAYTSEDGVAINLKDATYNVYLDVYGNVIGAEEVDPEDHYVFITGTDAGYSNLSTKTADVAAIFVDGTMKTIEVDMKKSDDALFNAAKAWNGTNDVNDLAILNTWCTYTVNDDGVYTLKIADKQSATDVGSSDLTIDKKHISLDGETGKVYGNDASVYLTVTLDTINTSSSTTAKIIDDVDSVSTGIKNTSLKVKDVTGASDNNNIPSREVYTLYNSNNWVIAAVVIGEDEGSSTNHAYVTSSKVSQEGYDKTTKEYTWSREVVIDGKLTEISYVGDTIDMIGTDSTHATAIMEQGKWYEVKYFADGTVKFVEEKVGTVANTDKYVDVVENIDDTFDSYVGDTAYLINATADKLTYKNGSLYTNTDATKGFALSPEVKVVLANAGKSASDTFKTVSDEYEGYEGIEDAIEDMNGNFTGEISAVLENGIATVVIINCKVADPGFSAGTVVDKSDSYKVALAVDSGKVVLTVTGLKAVAAQDFTWTATATNTNSGYVQTIEGAAAVAAPTAKDGTANADVASALNGLVVYQAEVVFADGTKLTTNTVMG